MLPFTNPSKEREKKREEEKKPPKLTFSSFFILGKWCVITSSSLTLSHHLHKEEQRKTSESGFSDPIFCFGWTFNSNLGLQKVEEFCTKQDNRPQGDPTPKNKTKRERSNLTLPLPPPDSHTAFHVVPFSFVSENIVLDIRDYFYSTNTLVPS